MQLFLCEFDLVGDRIIIDDKEVFHQLKNVLRVKIGYQFYVQKIIENTVHRFFLELKKINKNSLESGVLNIENKEITLRNTGIIIGMLNKFSKLETLVQKATEIGVENIIITPLSRSVVNKIGENKLKRLHKISKEAVEQSYGYILPKIKFIENYKKSSEYDSQDLLVVDMDGEKDYSQFQCMENTYILVGPEGGLSDQDYENFKEKIVGKINIGKNTYRAETAGIIASYYLAELL